MRDLWDTITENPALLIFLLMAVLSGLGNLATGAAKKAQQEQQRKAQAERARRGGSTPAPRRVEPAVDLEEMPSAQRHVAQGVDPEKMPSAQRHAAQGVDPEKMPSAQRQAVPVQPARTQPTPSEVADEIRRALGLGRERVEPPTAEPEPIVVLEDHARWTSERDRSAPGKPLAVAPPIVRFAASRAARGAQRRGSGVVDLSNPAAAVVMMEILGKPKSLRGPDSELF